MISRNLEAFNWMIDFEFTKCTNCTVAEFSLPVTLFDRGVAILGLLDYWITLECIKLREPPKIFAKYWWCS